MWKISHRGAVEHSKNMNNRLSGAKIGQKVIADKLISRVK